MSDLKDHPLKSTLKRVSPKKMASAREAVETEVISSHPNDDRAVIVDLNNVADMLVLLVGKWQKAYVVTIVCVVLILACVGLLVQAGFKIDALQYSQAGLLEELRKTKDEVRKTKDEVNKAKDQVETTKNKVIEVAENAPKVEIDDKGKARVILQAKKARTPKPKSSGALKIPFSEPSPSLVPMSSETSVPLDPQIGLEDDY